MRLKKLEMVGFKSFASRVALEFGEGITVIVGPNGCGKSNISDAVRWVLGEQSVRNLRGNRMEDIIFAGSESRKPLGMAEVQLTLDNSDGFLPIDYREITIARRVYRSGESEFLINRKNCRLKDIHDLFTDTGLGREGYAIIGQGQVDTVLSANPSDRRLLLEETAGIVKYRHRKEETQKKLRETELDLQRIADILGEVENRLGPLRIEEEKARKYQELAAQLRHAELDSFALQLSDYIGRRHELEEKIRQAAAEEEHWTREFAAGEARKAQTEEKLVSVQTELEQIQQDMTENTNELTEASQQLELGIERQKNTQSRISELTERSERAEQALAVLADEASRLASDSERVQAAIAEHRQNVLRLEEEHAQARKEREAQLQEIEERKNDFLEFMRKLADVRNLAVGHKQQQEAIERRRERLQAEAEELQNRVAFGEAQLADKRSYWEQAKREAADLDDMMAKCQAKISGLEKEMAKVLAEKGQAQRRYQHTESRLTALREVEEGYEGYGVAVRRIMQSRFGTDNLLGTVADVITVPSDLETAVEIALGGALQNIITDDQETAKRAVDWLKKNNAGRATFLPLDGLNYNVFPRSFDKFWELPGVLGPAVDLVSFDRRFLPAIASVLGRIVLTENLEAALELKKVLSSFHRIVTRDGDVISPSGAITGGSLQKRSAAGLLSRKNLLRDLTEQLEKERVDVERITAAESQLQNALEKLKTVAQGHEQGRQIKEREIAQLQQEISTLEGQVEAIRGQLASVKEEHQSLAGEIDRIAAEGLTAGRRVKEMESEESVRRQEITKLEAAAREAETCIEQIGDKLNAEKVALARLEAEYGGFSEKLGANRVRQEREQAEIAEIAQQIKNSQRVLRELVETIDRAKEKIAKARERQTALEKKQDDWRTKRSELDMESKATTTQLKEINQKLAAVQRVVHQAELEKNRIDLNIERIEEEMDRYDVEEEDLTKREVSESDTHLRRRISQLRSSLDDLGTVNLQAINEFQKLNERRFFLRAQLDDLREAKAKLEEAISRMDRTSRRLFLEAFQKVRKNFQVLFRELFQGGHADLVLTDEQDVLVSGIEVFAQPPGKKLQNLQLLSGGERALTAIALLFAIRRVKPTPFCILDEIDAALDDANLERFTKLMKNFARETQFLAISHRQGTMEAADTLYGVTMAEAAVSQLMSVKFA